MSDWNKPTDLDELDAAQASDEGVEIELLHPTTKAPLGCFVKIIGQDSEAFQAYIAKRENDRRQKEFLAARKNKVVEPDTYEADKKKGTDLLVNCTLGFRGIVMGGRELAFSPEAARKLYDNRGFRWLREQVDAAIINLENFIKS